MEHEKPTCSVVIATYNRAHLLPRSMESVLAQEGVSLELIVVDDGSTDGTEALVRGMSDSRVRCIRLPSNQGASAARNRGIREARGEFIMIWDSDDVLYPHALSRLLYEFETDPSLGVVSAPARVLVNGKEELFLAFPSGEVMLTDVLCKHMPSNEKVRVARGSIMGTVSYASRNIDFLVNVALVERAKWHHLNEYLADVFNDPEGDSLTSARKMRKRGVSIERAPYLAEFLLRHGARLKETCPERYADYCYGAAVGLLLDGRAAKARALAKEGVVYRLGAVTHVALFLLSYLPFGSRILGLFYR